MQSVSSLQQPWFTMYAHWHSSFTIDSVSLKSGATSLHYVQAPAQHFYKWFDQSRVWSKLNSLHTSTGTTLSQLIWSVSSLNQPQFTTYKHQHNNLTIDAISVESAATLIHYVHALAKQFHNWFRQYQVWSNLNFLRTITGATLWPLIQSVSRLGQPWFITYTHWQSSFTINSISRKSEATSIHFVQALAQYFHNQFDQSQVWKNLNSPSICTGKAVPQSIPSVPSLKQA